MEIPQEVFKHIRRIQIESGKLAEDILAGAYHSAFKGRGIEFEEVREYQPGDDIRSIDWNVTARQNKPFIKNFREERQLTVMLIVDISSSTIFGSKRKIKREIIAEIASLLAFTAAHNNDKVGLILFGGGIELYIPPKEGTKHLLRIIRDVLIYKPKTKGTSIKKALELLGKVQQKMGICFLISDFLCPTCPKALAVAAKRHDLVGISVRDPVEKEIPDLGLVRFWDSELQEAAIVDTSEDSLKKWYKERYDKHFQDWKTLFQRVGAGYVQVLTDRSYVNPIRIFFKQRRIRH